MTVKTTGAEFKRFYADAEFWPEGAWHEEEEILADGEENVSPQQETQAAEAGG